MADCPMTEKTKDDTDKVVLRHLSDQRSIPIRNKRIGNYMAEFECPTVSF